MNKELEALQNALNCIQAPNLSIHEYIENDKRKTIKKYYINRGGATISPKCEYDKMNHFLAGMIASQKYL